MELSNVSQMYLVTLDVHLLLGFGVSKFTFGGMVRFSKARIALIIEVFPLAASE
jgi:hypothetical protein